MALVRRHLWDHWRFATSPPEADKITVPRALFDRFIDVICYAAYWDKVELRGCLTGKRLRRKNRGISNQDGTKNRRAVVKITEVEIK
jgi:hypothetical protein